MFLIASDSQFIYETVSNGVITIAYRPWVSISIFVFSGLLAVIGWRLRRLDGIGPKLIIIGSVLFALLAPSFLCDSARVDQTGMTIRNGFWGLTARKFEYAKIQSVHLTETTYRNPERVVEHHPSMYCDTTDGPTDEVRVSNRIDRTAFKYFEAELKKREIPIHNHRTTLD